MSAFKKLRSADSFYSVHNAHKSYTVTSASFSTYGITLSNALEYTDSVYTSNAAYTQSLNYRSIKHLYYDNFNLTGSPLQSGSYEHYLESSLFSGSRILPESASIVSLPKDIVGTHIKPGSFTFTVDLGVQAYKFENLGFSNQFISQEVDAGLACGDYPNSGTSTVYGENRVLKNNTDLFDNPELTDDTNTPGFYSDGYTWVEIDLSGNVISSGDCSLSSGELSKGVPIYSGSKFTLQDNGEGALSGSGTVPAYLTSSVGTRDFYGDIIYKHGLVLITDDGINSVLNSTGMPIYTASWEASHPVFIANNYCKVRSSDFLFTSNPSACQSQSALSGSLSYSGGLPKDNVTGSYFAPYITTVGLYNDAHELIAVAKLGQPIPKSKTNDMTFVVKFDI